MPLPRRLSSSVAFALLLASASVSAADLLEIYRLALASDPVYSAARASWTAGQEKLPQGRAGLLPVISGSANTVRNEVDYQRRVNDPVLGWKIDSQYNINGYQLVLTQPLLRWQNYEQHGQSKLAVAQADALFSQARQDLILRVKSEMLKC